MGCNTLYAFPLSTVPPTSGCNVPSQIWRQQVFRNVSKCKLYTIRNFTTYYNIISVQLVNFHSKHNNLISREWVYIRNEDNKNNVRMCMCVCVYIYIYIYIYYTTPLHIWIHKLLKILTYYYNILYGIIYTF